MLTGLTTNLPTDCLLNAGALFYSKASVATKIGVTEGAPDFDPGLEYADIEFDGKRARIKGQTRKNGCKPIIKGVLKEFGMSASGNQIALLEAMSAEGVPAGGVTTVTPGNMGILLSTSTGYVNNLRWIFERAGGGFAAILFTIALCTKWSLKGADKKEGQISFEFEAVQDPSVDQGTIPYVIELRTALPTT